jgi:gluconolactonase
MRWLWKDWPSVVTKGTSKNPYQTDLLIPGEDWELVGEGYGFTEGTVANAKGEVFFHDIPNSKAYKVGLDGKVTMISANTKKGSGECMGVDGKRYVVTGIKQILSYDANGKESVVVDTLAGNDLVMANNGNLYITAPDGRERPSKIYLIRPNGERVVVDEGLKYANGIALTPDQTQLYVTESATHWVWIYKINPDGTLGYKQHYGWLHTLDTDDNALSDGMKCDTAGRVYVTSKLGLQVLDQIGRVNAILPLPDGQSSNCCFGGANFDMLYVSCGSKVYRRKLRTRGVNPFESPMKPKKPSL